MPPLRPLAARTAVPLALTPAQPNSPAAKQTRHRHTDDEWEQQKPTIFRLLAEGAKREDVVKILGDSPYNFKTCRRKFFLKLKDWNDEGNRKRRREEDGGNPGILSKSKLVMPDDKITPSAKRRAIRAVAASASSAAVPDDIGNKTDNQDHVALPQSPKRPAISYPPSDHAEPANHHQNEDSITGVQKYFQGAESIKTSDEWSSDIPISIRPEVVDDIESSDEWTAHLGTLSDSIEDEPSPVTCASVVADSSCSHQLPKTFRLKEINPDGTSHNYDISTDRSCLGENICDQCASDGERRPKTIFEVTVSQQRLDVTILSQDLYSYLKKVLQIGLGGVNETFDGRVLLKSYTSLKTHLDQLRSSSHVAKINQGLIEECALLVEGFISNLTAFKNFNGQELHDNDLVDDQLRQVFTQQQVECGMEALDLAFTAIDARETARLQTQTHKESSPACLSIIPELEVMVKETETYNPSEELEREDLQIKEILLHYDELGRMLTTDPRYHPLRKEWEREWIVCQMRKLKWDTEEREWMIRTWERERTGCWCLFDRAVCIQHEEGWPFGRTGYMSISMSTWKRKIRNWMKYKREARERMMYEVEKIIWNPVIMILGMEKTQFDREMRERIMRKWEEEEEGETIDWCMGSLTFDFSMFVIVYDYARWTQSKKEECEMEQLDEEVRKWIVDEMKKLGWATEWREWVMRLWRRESVIRQRMRNLLCEIGRHEWEGKVRGWMKSEREKYGWMLYHMDKREWDNDMRVWLMQQWERRMPVCMTLETEIERHEWEREICKWMEHEREVREKLRRLDSRSANDRREEARLRKFHSNFISQYQLLKQATKHLLTELDQLPEQIQSHREAWDVAMRTMRGLSRLERPKCLMDALCFLCVSRAVAETAGDNGSSYISAFNEGLEQWRSMFPEIDEVAWLMWEVTLGSIQDDQSTAEQHDAMLRLRYSVAELIETANGLFDTEKLNERDEMDEDQPFHQLTAKNIPQATPDIEVSDPPNIATEKDRLDQVITRLGKRTQGTASFNIVILVASIIFALVVHAMLGLALILLTTAHGVPNPWYAEMAPATWPERQPNHSSEAQNVLCELALESVVDIDRLHADLAAGKVFSTSID